MTPFAHGRAAVNGGRSGRPDAIERRASMRSFLMGILAVVAGYVAWVAAFYGPIILLGFVWPALRAAAQAFFEVNRYDVFATSMLIAFQLVWPIANIAAGLVTRLIAKRQLEVWCIAVLLFCYFVVNHLWLLWDQLPKWYNVIVVIPVVPMILLGGAIGRRLAERRRAGSAREAATA
jgi:hypothetical protein